MQSASTEAVILRDTTLREGVQIPGSRVSAEHKRRFVALLEEVGLKEVEIGLPGGVEACADLAEFIRRRGLGIQPSALVPCYGRQWRREVDAAGDAGLNIDVLAPVSDVLLRERDHYGLTEDQVLPRLEEVLSYAQSREVPASAALVDACRAPLDRVLGIAEALDGLGACRCVLYDSVGTMLPWTMREFIAAVRGVTPLPILVHCHNDHGLATANTLAALDAGAAAADVAVNGLGGRAGNAPLEEVALALERLCRRPTGLDTTRLRELSAFAEEMTGVSNSPLKPIVGRFCFAHVPVMHIRCIAGGNPEAFEAFDPRLIGAERTYDFCLPVDYAPALEPFLRKCSCTVPAERMPPLLARLRDQPAKTEPQVLQCIRDFGSGSGADAARTD